MTPTPVFIVCSPRPRIGKTLLARLLAEYCRRRRPAVTAFDVNPGRVRAGRLSCRPTPPARASTTPAAQMALFDQLVLDDDDAKVVDLGHTLFEQFFTVAATRSASPKRRAAAASRVVLFVADPRRSLGQRTYAMLREQFPR